MVLLARVRGVLHADDDVVGRVAVDRDAGSRLNDDVGVAGVVPIKPVIGRAGCGNEPTTSASAIRGNPSWSSITTRSGSLWSL